jgi:ferrous iron transport protein B
MLLSELQNGEKGVIVKVNGSGAFRKRILEMGFIKGKTITVVLNAPLKDPIKYKIMDYEVSLRRSEAGLVEIMPVNGEKGIASPTESHEAFTNRVIAKTSNGLLHDPEDGIKEIKVALVGNPNAGKTSLFNFASGSHEHVGNYGGVTVNSKEGFFKHKGYQFTIIDLPGTYSISAYTPEELFVRKHIVTDKPDVIINVVAASNLERNLYLTTELIDMEAQFVIALNMYDELQRSGNTFDYENLAKMISVPIVPTNSRSGEGIEDLFDAVIQKYENQAQYVKHVNIYYGNTIENAISRLRMKMDKHAFAGNEFPQRYVAIKLLEKDSDIDKYVKMDPNGPKLLELRDSLVAEIESILQEDSESAFTNARYGYIAGGLTETLQEKENDLFQFTPLIDKLVTNKYIGFPMFILFMWIMFECTFRLGAYPMDWIDGGVAALGEWLKEFMPEGMLKDLLIDGVIGGVGGVIVFLPNILILYAFISFMEDSGYMARAAFIMDKVMHKMGLHGKSFIPLVMGFGCNVPAVMATRTIESRNSRMITMLINPFMSCSARLPVYLLFAGAFFKEHAGLVLFGLYFTGILLAVFSARLFKQFLFKGEDSPFVMELPPYRVPTVKSVGIHMWDKSRQYLRKMGGIILVASIIVWFLGYFPLNQDQAERSERQIAAIEQNFKGKKITEEDQNNQISEIKKDLKRQHQANSFIGQIGQFIEPAMRPLGFDWKISVSLLSAMPAKEIAVSTLSVLYTGEEDAESSLQQRLINDTQPDGSLTFSPLTVAAFLLFVLIYFPCIATVVAIKEESGSWKWGLFSIFYSTSLAWIVAFIAYNLGGVFL